MRTIRVLVFMALFAFSSTFFIDNFILIERVEAACGPGQYIKENGGCAIAMGNGSEVVGNSLGDPIVKLFNIVSGVLLAIGLLTIIYAAYVIMTSMGEPQKVTLGKKLLMGSGLGIVIILSSFTIMRLVMSIIGISS